MAAPILLTTFAPWRAHQASNASEDLLIGLEQRHRLPPNLTLMRQLPVNFDLAPGRVIATMMQLRPAVVVCCGMAEQRSYLTLERYGNGPNRVLQTSLGLELLMTNTRLTAISTCAGTYVCNHLYYHVLDAIERYRWPSQAIFIHVPKLTAATEPFLVADLALILRRLGTVPNRLAQLAAA
ncbi:MAG: peptidase C15 [Nodosilinea sp.]